MEKVQLEFVIKESKEGERDKLDTGWVAGIRSMTECADAGLALDGSMDNNNRGEGRIYRYGGRWSRLKMRKQE